jgi:hypothetical protein
MKLIQTIRIDSGISIIALPDLTIYKEEGEIKTGSAIPDSLVAFGKSLVGTLICMHLQILKMASIALGLSLMYLIISAISVPRSSVDFTNVGIEIPKEFASPGDLILFTGTDSTIRTVGHMGIVESNERGNLLFLHSTSGKAYGVVISPLNGYYEARFVKVIRVFPQTYFATP